MDRKRKKILSHQNSKASGSVEKVSTKEELECKNKSKKRGS
jgi:hypothetical protein